MQPKGNRLPAKVKRTIDDPTRCSTCGGKLEPPAVDMGSDLCFSCQTKSIPEAAEWLKLQAQHPLKNTMEMDELLRKMRHPSRSAKLRAFMEGVDRSGVFRELPTKEFQELSPDEFKAQQIKQTEPLYRLDEGGVYNEINPDELWTLVPLVPPIDWHRPPLRPTSQPTEATPLEDVPKVTSLTNSQLAGRIAKLFTSEHKRAMAMLEITHQHEHLSDERFFELLAENGVIHPKGYSGWNDYQAKKGKQKHSMRYKVRSKLKKNGLLDPVQ
jgi:hypothetical protein